MNTLFKDIIKALETCSNITDESKELESTDESNEPSNPCLDGYEMIGMKEEDGRQVPNCVLIEEKK